MIEQTNYSEMRRDFYEKYQKNIVPEVRKFEKERKIKLIFAIISATILSIIGFSLLILTDYNSDGIQGAIFFFSFAWGAWLFIKKGFECKIKQKIMPIVCSCFENLQWTSDYYLSGEYLEASGVVPKYTTDSYDDIFSGVHRGVDIEMVECELLRGSGKNRTTVFDGVVVRLDMNKKFKSHTVVTPNALFHFSPVSGLRQTTLEDVQFEKKFDVFTNDEVEARYLITPTFMERLMGVQTAFHANKISCAFYGKYLLVGLNTNKDLFSICSLVKPMDDSQQYFQMYEEIASIIKLIDYFKLDQKIGL